MCDQRLVVRQLRPRTGSHRLGSQPRLTLGLQRRQSTRKVRNVMPTGCGRRICTLVSLEACDRRLGKRLELINERTVR
jgi:hypothetical protein